MGDLPTDTAVSTAMDAPTMARTIRRLAHEIAERNPDPKRLVVVGILTRGAHLAHRLAALVGEFTGAPVAAAEIDVTPFRDDLGSREAPPILDIEFRTDDRIVVIVDDVIYTGRTVRAALGAVIAVGRPAETQLAVLVDRGHREMPVKPDYVGKNLPTSHSERVTVLMAEVDGIDEVRIEPRHG